MCVTGMPVGIGDTHLKTDANLAKAMLSIIAKGFEIGDGFKAADTKAKYHQ